MIQKPDFIRGKWQTNIPLSKMTWLKLGGTADVFFEPADIQDLQDFLQHYDGPLTVLGGGSNTLVRDGGIRGVVIHLGSQFIGITASNATLKVKTGTPSRNVAIAAAKAGLTGLEFLYTIPGTLGGGMRTNAGCYGGELADHLTEIQIVTRDGKLKTLSNAACGFSYRNSKIPKDCIVVEATFECAKGNSEDILKQMEETQAKRNASQPFGQATAGSTFKNPEGDSAGRLIEAAGLKGHAIGGVRVSEKHVNFFINDGTGTAADFEALLYFVQDKVFQSSGIKLTPEVQFVGEK
ncbi:MAG: UDP-N-acetylmuramate dehydrogenase [Alphaproteobacteria bacterium]|nr:UDP-N-acetylmuramate dehydrogenase [Alphaproteobacteria bacterium]